MRTFTYLAIGIAGTLAYQRISDNRVMLMREARKMMNRNNRSMQRIKEIF